MGMTSSRFLVARQGAEVVIREFDPAAHPVAAKTAWAREAAWEFAGRLAQPAKQATGLRKLAAPIFFQAIDGTCTQVADAPVPEGSQPKIHKYRVTMLLRKSKSEQTFTVEAPNKKDAVAQVRAQIAGATTLVSCERVEDASDEPVSSPPAAPAVAKLPWE